MFGLPNFVHYITNCVKSRFRSYVEIVQVIVVLRFVISRFCPIHFTVILPALKNSLRYIEDLFKWKFVKLRFQCTSFPKCLKCSCFNT